MSSFFVPDCPFCPTNGKVDIIDETDDAYLTQVVQVGCKVEDRFFIIPKEHLTSYFSLPDTWDVQFKGLLRAIDPKEYLTNFNLSWNFGHDAGQRLEHIHCWIILRTDMLGIGMSGMIDELCDRRNADDSMVLASGGEPLYHEPDDPQY